MKIKNLIIEFITVFAGTLAVTAMVTLLWNLVGHGAWSIDWGTSFRSAVVFSIILPWNRRPRAGVN